MTDDLTTRLTGALHALEARETGAAPGELEAIHRDVRRRRVLRATQHASVAAVAAVAVGVAGWFGLHRAPVEPVETPTPSPTVTPDPTRSPTPSPTATPTSAPTPVTVEGMPPMLALDASVLASAGPGWAVGLYTNGYGDPYGVDGRLLPTALVVAAPTGELYATGMREDGAWLNPVHWDGSSSVVVQHADEQDGSRHVVDLLTGVVVPDSRGLPVRSSFLALTPGGDEVWFAYAAETTEWWVVPPTGAARQVGVRTAGYPNDAMVSPDGVLVALTEWDDGSGDAVVVDIATGRTTPLAPAPDGQTCGVTGWADATHVLLLCSDDGIVPPRPGQRPRLVRQDVTGREAPVVVREIADDESAPQQVYPVGDGRLVAALAPVTEESMYCAEDTIVEMRPDGSTTPLDHLPLTPGRLVGIIQVRTGYMEVVDGVSCGGDSAPAAFLVVDMWGGGTWRLPAGQGPDARYPVGLAVVPRP